MNNSEKWLIALSVCLIFLLIGSVVIIKKTEKEKEELKKEVIDAKTFFFTYNENRPVIVYVLPDYLNETNFSQLDISLLLTKKNETR